MRTALDLVRSFQANEPRSAADLAAPYRAVRRATESLVAPLSSEDCALQSMPDCSPTKWHMAHTSWFFETFVLEPTLAGYQWFNPTFRVLFNSYYQSVGEQYARPRRALLTRPSLDEVKRYRQHVDEQMAALFENPNPSHELAAIVELGIHHEQQHQELILTDLKHLFSFNPLHPVYQPRAIEPIAAIKTIEWMGFEGGLTSIGHGGSGFAFDNEGPRHRVYLQSYRLASRLVTNGEFVAFIEAGGYDRPEYWLSDGWNKICAESWRHPLYWERRDGAWFVHTLHGFVPLDLSEPACHISYYEADAYAHFAGARLPTEMEWEHAAERIQPAGNFVESGRFHPAPLGNADGGMQQLFGDVWEWTASSYSPYPGFTPPAGALGEYNGKFMSSQMVLRGGSCATPMSHIRASYRNFFPPDARWQFSGIRLAHDA
ncbi:MAG: ergothioneine biosynthesis protein EgtB [Burkholderiales bacterium]